MIKKILAALSAAVVAVTMSGCSKYTMTNEDLELQQSLIGIWAADDSTGYNEYDENGNITMMVAVRFTNDFNYLLYNCFLNDRQVLTYEPISYTIEEGKFKVERDGLASYAGVSISADGNTMSWITDSKTDVYLRLPDDRAAELGIPEYDASYWNKDDEDGSEADTEGGSDADTDSSEE